MSNNDGKGKRGMCVLYLVLHVTVIVLLVCNMMHMQYSPSGTQSVHGCCRRWALSNPVTFACALAILSTVLVPTLKYRYTYTHRSRPKSAQVKLAALGFYLIWKISVCNCHSNRWYARMYSRVYICHCTIWNIHPATLECSWSWLQIHPEHKAAKP